MIDINLIRTDSNRVKENIRKKFQHEKLGCVDKVLELDKRQRELKIEADNLRASRNKVSSQIGLLMKQKKLEDVEKLKLEMKKNNERILEIDKELEPLADEIRNLMMTIPNIIDDDVPIGKDDSENVQRLKVGRAEVPQFEIPHHADIMESFAGLDLDSARRCSGNAFYYLVGDIALLHSAILTYARNFMVEKGFTYCIPPFMIRKEVVDGVMSFSEMENMMYKIENENLYLIGTSEHSMIGRFKDTIVKEDSLPILLTSYSPCFRKEVGAHGLEERGIYRVHQFEKQEMIVICKPEDSHDWYNKMWQISSEFFKTLDIPHEIMECCSGDLADLKVKSCDINAWSPRQKKYFGELGSCSNLSDAQARRLAIRYKTNNGTKFVHTLNNTVVAPPRMLIAFLENNLQKDGSVLIPKALQPYMNGRTKIPPKVK